MIEETIIVPDNTADIKQIVALLERLVEISEFTQTLLIEILE